MTEIPENEALALAGTFESNVHGTCALLSMYIAQYGDVACVNMLRKHVPNEKMRDYLNEHSQRGKEFYGWCAHQRKEQRPIISQMREIDEVKHEIRQ